MRYKRYRKKYGRRSTNVIKMKFQSFMDISTNDTSMQVITVSAGGREIIDRLYPQFGAYKYYRIGNISVKLVPASTLPVDPTGLSYSTGEGSEMYVDPRDQLTPGMMRITNGEDVFEDISGLTDAQQHGIYNNMLLDPRWYKWMLQTGVKRHAIPRYWQIGQLHQDKWPGAFTNVPWIVTTEGGGSEVLNGTAVDKESVLSSSPVHSVAGASSQYGFFQTGHKGVLGWLPTDGLQNVQFSGAVHQVPLTVSPPEVEVMKIILPKAYKTRYYYRMFITETVYFKEPIVNFGVKASDGGYYRPLDVFKAGNYVPLLPSDGSTAVLPTDAELNKLNGGNYGDS